jgi:hypothetical protein
MKTKLCEIKNRMLAMIMSQMDHLDTVDVCELGEAIDIIKDIAEAEYYCSVVYAMDNKEPASTNTAYQTHNVNTYLHTLANDIHKMMDTMSPEERMMMRDKLHDLEQML